MAKMCGDIQNLDPEVQAQLILKFFVDNEAPDGLDMRPDDYSRPMTEIMRRRHAPHQRHAILPAFRRAVDPRLPGMVCGICGTMQEKFVILTEYL